MRVGSRVRIDGLSRRQDLNGCEAEVVLHAGDRLGVRVVPGNECVLVRTINLSKNPGLCERLHENSDLLRTIVNSMDVASLCSAKATNRQFETLCKSALRGVPVRKLYEHDRLRPGTNVQSLMQRAYQIDWADDRPSDWFAGSAAPRTARPHGMRFRVGDVYFHGQTGAFGVVLGWDDRRRAPLREWGQLLPERLYAVHYSVVEFMPPRRLHVPDNGDPFANDGAVHGDWFDENLVSTRYIVEENMLSIGDVWAGRLPQGQHSGKDGLAALVWDCYCRGGIHGAHEYDMQMQSLGVLWPDQGDEHSSYPWLTNAFAAQHGFLCRHAGSEADARVLSRREVGRGHGFIPDEALRVRYPADGPYA